MTSRRSLVFLSPCLPDPRGTGWEQRAYSLLSAYSRSMDVHVWFMPTIDHPDLSRIAPLLTVTRSAHAFYPCAFQDPNLGLQGHLMRQIAAADVVHVSRLAQVAANISHRCIVWDIDELPWSAKNSPSAGTAARDAAARANPVYALAAQRCQVVMACSELERLAGAKAFVAVPNVVPEPAAAEAAASAQRDGLLFVGNLNYLPNIDALVYFQEQILPLLVVQSPEVRVTVIGRGPATDEAAAAVERLRRSPQFVFEFDVPDCAPYYARCMATIAPIRIGGGTRIKIVESFAHRRPVISTSKGCEGLNVADGAQLLIADDPNLFAQRCTEVLRDHALRCSLGEAGRDCYERSYTQASVDRLLAEMLERLASG